MWRMRGELDENERVVGGGSGNQDKSNKSAVSFFTSEGGGLHEVDMAFVGCVIARLGPGLRSAFGARNGIIRLCSGTGLRGVHLLATGMALPPEDAGAGVSQPQ